MVLSIKHKIAIFIVGLSAFVLFLVAGLNSESFGPKAKPVVRTFPSVEIAQLDDRSLVDPLTLFSSDYQLVNVWASWCGICRSEHAYLNQLASEGIAIIGLNYRDQRSGANNYLGELGNPYQQTLFDPKGKLAIDLGVIGTPETYLVTGEGEIVYKHSGLMNERVWNKHFASYFEPARIGDNDA